MTLLDLISNELSKLTEQQEVFEEYEGVIQSYTSQLAELSNIENILNVEESIGDYDFSKYYKILNENEIDHEEDDKYLLEIKQVIAVRRQCGIDIPLSDEQKNVISIIRSNINYLKEVLNNKIVIINQEIEEVRRRIEENSKKKALEELKEVLEGNRRRKYYTEDMITALASVIDLENLSDEDFENIMKDFYETKNLQNRNNREKEDINNVISLYKEYLPESEFVPIEDKKQPCKLIDMIREYEDEISVHIDLNNTREILEFFKEKGILDRFRRPALLKVSIFAKASYVKELYQNIMEKHPDELDIYFEDVACTLWVCDTERSKINPFRVSRKRTDKKNKESLFSQCHSITEKEFRNNIKYLVDHSDIFERSEFEEIGAHLKAKTLNTEILKNNEVFFRDLFKKSWVIRNSINMFDTFEIGQNYSIPVSILSHGELDAKIHFAIELGLLNPPMDKLAREQEKDIANSEQFLNVKTHKAIHNNSIRNYFQRNLSVLGSLTGNDYVFLKYMLDNLGPIDFYNFFFNSERTGRRNKTEIEGEMLSAYEKVAPGLPIDEQADKFASTYFINDLYNVEINGYDEYDYVISQYDKEYKTSMDRVDYYDENILNDPLVKYLEDNFSINDELTQMDSMVEQQNRYAYRIGHILISRLKVLHNASILKEQYGILTEDMLLTAVIRNSYLNEQDFNFIKTSVTERRMR